MMKQEDYDKMEVGQHAWVLLGKEVAVVMKDKNSFGFEVCGAWECGCGIDDVELIELIERPKLHSETKLYYC